VLVSLLVKRDHGTRCEVGGVEERECIVVYKRDKIGNNREENFL
jgi:hypothetical protein